jgi:hypothetical protein
MPWLMTLGVGLFFAGGLLFLGLLFGSGGVQRSRQFAVIGELLRGTHGASRRRGVIVALALLGTGALTCFAGVGAMDAERSARCRDYCVVEGYDEGRIGPSVDREKATRFVACTCTAADRAALELRADAMDD